MSNPQSMKSLNLTPNNIVFPAYLNISLSGYISKVN